MNLNRNHTWLIILLFSCLAMNQIIAQETVISGMVLDFQTKEPLPFASIIFKGTQIGVTADVDGRYELRTTDMALDKMTISYTGFDTRNVQITPGINQKATIELKPEDYVLTSVDIVAEKRVKKDTAANTLFRNVVRHKPDNAPKEYDNYAFQSYTKTIFGLYEVSDKIKSRIVVRKIPFIFDNLDTIPENDVVILPGLMKESFTHELYRKQPKKNKEYLMGDKFTGVDNASISDLVEFNYEDVDVYGNLINVNGKPVMSPFANNALLNYKFFLTDTQNIDGYYCYKLQFTGRSIKDNTFSGSAWIHDTTFAIKHIELTLLPQSNVNFISYFKLDQGFKRIEGKYWFKDYESFQTNMNVFKKPGKQSFMVKKESWRSNILVNHPAIDTLVNGEPKVVIENAREQDEEFWSTVRKAPLTPQESRVDVYADSVLDTRIVKFLGWTLNLLRTRYFIAGPIDIGQVDQLYSYNALEGPRVKVGARTSNELTDRILLGGHVAYGFDDDLVKYGAYSRLHLKKRNELWHMLEGGYRFDYSFIEQRESNDVHDNILNVILQSDPIDNIFLTREGHFSYQRDWIPGLTTNLKFARREFIGVPGKYDFDVDETGDPEAGFTVSEIGFTFTFAKGLKYYESSSSFTRSPITTIVPRLILDYKTSIDNLFGANVGYHKLELQYKQRLMSPIGYTNLVGIAGKIFGAVPYPLLELHRGNESVYYEKLSYNIMNDFEFASDTYVSLWIEHHFDGFLFNKIPGIKYLQLRSILYYKVLFGWLEEKNEDVVPFLDELKPLNGHYMEIGFGFENILKLVRIDAIWRLTQKNQPDVNRWGIRFSISPKF